MSGAERQLTDRRQRLETALAGAPGNDRLVLLLSEVDSALEKIGQGTYGLCETCHDPIEPERLAADPLLRFCLDHLTEPERHALSQDLELAGRIQAGLLPAQECRLPGWEAFFHYEPARLVSGDYCDILDLRERQEVLFLVGDVAGKGVAASMLMAQLHAVFRSLAGYGLAPGQLVARANRLFCESTPASHYATLIIVRALPSGEVDICNAGHCPALLLRGSQAASVGKPAFPLGLFADAEYPVERVSLAPGDALLLYSDGLIEACDHEQKEFGFDRLCEALRQHAGSPPRAMIGACLEGLRNFRRGAPLADDLTAMAVRRR